MSYLGHKLVHRPIFMLNQVGGDKRRRMGGGGENMDSLPDDLVLDILGRLKFRDAAAAALVSPRFLNLWTISTRLDFKDDADPHQPSLPGIHFMKFVNFILSRHEPSPVDSLRIAFDAECVDNYRDVQASLENWVEFARSKSVRSLEIDLCGSPATGESPFYFYLHELYGLKTLTSLSLKYIVVLDEDDIPSLLETSLLNLENLVIENASCLHHLQIKAPKLKNLEIRHCPDLCSIDIISAPNLRSFKKSGDFENLVKLSLCRNPLPKLSYAYLEGLVCQNVSELKKYAPCLKALEVDIDHLCRDKMQFSELEKLVINFGILDEEDMVVDIIHGCPNLQDLTLKYVVPQSIPLEKVWILDSWPQLSSHTRLRRVTFVGWRGKNYELEFCRYLMEIATNLETVAFDTNPSDPQWYKRKGDEGYRDSGYKEWECRGDDVIIKHQQWKNCLLKVKELFASKPKSVAFRFAEPRILPDHWGVSTYQDLEENCWDKYRKLRSTDWIGNSDVN